MKVWESPLVPSHLTFKSFEFTHFQSINQTINQIYLFIITFQNFEFWDVTNLPPLKGISSWRFREARNKWVWFGVFSKSIDHHTESGVLPPLETSLRSHQYSYTSSSFLTGPVFSNSRKIPSLGSSHYKKYVNTWRYWSMHDGLEVRHVYHVIIWPLHAPWPTILNRHDPWRFLAIMDGS